jgi:N-acetylmuramoyl-L-alanine amidase
MSKPIICIDPGHGGKDPGALGPNGLKESTVVLSVALLLASQLANVAEVVLTRKDDTFIELSQRCRIANEAKAKFFLSIHCNSAVNPAAGIETFIAPNSTTAVILGEAVQDSMTDAFPSRIDRGLKRAGFAVLRGTNMPAALAELEFIHTAQGEEFLGHKPRQLIYAKALNAAVRVALGLARPIEHLPRTEPPAHPPIDLKAEVLRISKELQDLATRA